MSAERITDEDRASEWFTLVAPPIKPPVVPRIVSRVTTWSDGTVHVERPGEPTQVVVPLEGF